MKDTAQGPKIIFPRLVLQQTKTSDFILPQHDPCLEVQRSVCTITEDRVYHFACKSEVCVEPAPV